jgi:hypothetical protein
MTAFCVVVRTEKSSFTYTAIGAHCCDVIASAVDQFGVCSVTAVPEKI